MHIGLNLLHMHEGIGGVWNYVENLIEAIGRYDKKNTYFVFVTKKSQSVVPDQSNFIKILININPLNTVQRVVFENTILNYYSWKYKLDCFHWVANVLSPFLIIPGLVTIHDLFPVRKPEAYSKIKYLYLNMMLKITAKKATSILPISHTTESDVMELLKPKTDKIYVLPVIINSDFKPSILSLVERFKKSNNLPENYWLYVANFYPHKNHLRLIRAYAKLKKNGFKVWPLVLRGDFTTSSDKLLKDELRKLNIENDIIFLDRLSYNELPLLYSGASGLIFPSLFEGGGIPIIEAMACGCAVAASNIPVIKEFAGDAVEYFNGNDLEDICNAMMKLQSDDEYRDHLINKGLKRARLFTGSIVVEKLLVAYKDSIVR